MVFQLCLQIDFVLADGRHAPRNAAFSESEIRMSRIPKIKLSDVLDKDERKAYRRYKSRPYSSDITAEETLARSLVEVAEQVYLIPNYKPMRLSDADLDICAVIAQDCFARSRKIDGVLTRDVATAYGLSLQKARYILWEFMKAGVIAYDGAFLAWNGSGEDRNGFDNSLHWFFT
jgi:hypothetical protein